MFRSLLSPSPARPPPLQQQPFDPAHYCIAGLWYRCWVCVATFCDADSLYTLACVCSTLREIADYDSLWQHLTESNEKSKIPVLVSDGALSSRLIRIWPSAPHSSRRNTAEMKQSFPTFDGTSSPPPPPMIIKNDQLPLVHQLSFDQCIGLQQHDTQARGRILRWISACYARTYMDRARAQQGKRLLQCQSYSDYVESELKLETPLVLLAALCAAFDGVADLHFREVVGMLLAPRSGSAGGGHDFAAETDMVLAPSRSNSAAKRLSFPAAIGAVYARRDALAFIEGAALKAAYKSGVTEDMLGVFALPRIIYPYFHFAGFLLGISVLVAAYGVIVTALLHPLPESFWFTPCSLLEMITPLPSPHDRFWALTATNSSSSGNNSSSSSPLLPPATAYNWDRIGEIVGMWLVRWRRTSGSGRNEGTDLIGHLSSFALQPLFHLKLFQLLLRTFSPYSVASSVQFLWVSAPPSVWYAGFHDKSLFLDVAVRSAAKECATSAAEFFIFFAIAVAWKLWPIIVAFSGVCLVLLTVPSVRSDSLVVRAVTLPLVWLARLSVRTFLPELDSSVTQAAARKVRDVLVRVASTRVVRVLLFLFVVSAMMLLLLAPLKLFGGETAVVEAEEQQQAGEAAPSSEITSNFILGTLPRPINRTPANVAELSIHAETLLTQTLLTTAVIIGIDLSTFGAQLWLGSGRNLVLRVVAVLLLFATTLLELRERLRSAVDGIVLVALWNTMFRIAWILCEMILCRFLRIARSVLPVSTTAFPPLHPLFSRRELRHDDATLDPYADGSSASAIAAKVMRVSAEKEFDL